MSAKKVINKNAVVIFLLLVSTVKVSSQSFEGSLSYKIDCKSKTAKITDAQLSQLIGSKQSYIIKEGNYKSITNGSMIQWQLYVNAENKIYNKKTDSDTIIWKDASLNDDSVVDFKINRGAVDILGMKCDELILTCVNSTQKYYFNAKNHLESKLFLKHNYGNWFFYLSKTNAVPLKMIIETPQFTMESTATSINTSTIDDREFSLPANAVLIRDPSEIPVTQVAPVNTDK